MGGEKGREEEGVLLPLPLLLLSGLHEGGIEGGGRERLCCCRCFCSQGSRWDTHTSFISSIIFC